MEVVVMIELYILESLSLCGLAVGVLQNLWDTREIKIWMVEAIM